MWEVGLEQRCSQGFESTSLTGCENQDAYRTLCGWHSASPLRGCPR